MDIDHHDPTKSKTTKNSYDNLFLASRHCNGKKGQNWPTAEQREAGIRFLNPCREIDYGQHIFEDPKTFHVWGATPAGRYHIRILDLNAEHLVRERRNRAKLRALWKQEGRVTLAGTPGLDDEKALDGLAALREEIAQMIPDIIQKEQPLLPS